MFSHRIQEGGAVLLLLGHAVFARSPEARLDCRLIASRRTGICFTTMLASLYGKRVMPTRW
jgi:hypothetical protein